MDEDVTHRVDPLLDAFYRRNGETGELTVITPADWHDAIRTPQLSESVPVVVREMFEESREAMLHGTHSLAFFTRGLEHALTTADAAVTICARTAGVAMQDAHGHATSFKFRLRGLKKLQILTEADLRAWTGTRELRNFCAHAEQPFRLPPAVTISIVAELVTSINRLYRMTLDRTSFAVSG